MEGEKDMFSCLSYQSIFKCEEFKDHFIMAEVVTRSSNGLASKFKILGTTKVKEMAHKFCNKLLEEGSQVLVIPVFEEGDKNAELTPAESAQFFRMYYGTC